MKIYTSNFFNESKRKHLFPIAISMGVPKFYNGKGYRKLAPPYWLIKNYKETGDINFYTENYYDKVLNKLDPHDVVRELSKMSGGHDVVLLCFEKSNQFCHRHIVRKWLNKYNIQCEEFIQGE